MNRSELLSNVDDTVSYFRDFHVPLRVGLEMQQAIDMLKMIYLLSSDSYNPYSLNLIIRVLKLFDKLQQYDLPENLTHKISIWSDTMKEYAFVISENVAKNETELKSFVSAYHHTEEYSNV